MTFLCLTDRKVHVDIIHKWQAIHYSFVVMQTSLPGLVVMC